MKIYTEYLYSFANASLTLRVIEYLRNQNKFPLDSVAVINLIDRWIVNVKMRNHLDFEIDKNIQAFLLEMGVPYQPSPRVAMTLQELAAGKSPTEVMNRHQIVIVAYGKPEKEDIEVFRSEIVNRLGYCPQNMA